MAAQSFSVSLGFPDGSLATIAYEAGGAPGLGKEYVEVHSAGRSAVLDDFKTLTLYEGRRARKQRGVGGGKGHREQFAQFARALSGNELPALPAHLDTMRVTLAAARSAEVGRTVSFNCGTSDERLD